MAQHDKPGWLISGWVAEMAGTDPVKAKAAKAAMTRLAHEAAAPGSNKQLKTDVIRALLFQVDATPPKPRLVRAHAVRLLGYLGGRGEAKALERFEGDPEIGEDVHMARERLRRS